MDADAWSSGRGSSTHTQPAHYMGSGSILTSYRVSRFGSINQSGDSIRSNIVGVPQTCKKSKPPRSLVGRTIFFDLFGQSELFPLTAKASGLLFVVLGGLDDVPKAARIRDCRSRSESGSSPAPFPILAQLDSVEAEQL